MDRHLLSLNQIKCFELDKFRVQIRIVVVTDPSSPNKVLIYLSVVIIYIVCALI